MPSLSELSPPADDIRGTCPEADVADVLKQGDGIGELLGDDRLELLELCIEPSPAAPVVAVA